MGLHRATIAQGKSCKINISKFEKKLANKQMSPGLSKKFNLIENQSMTPPQVVHRTLLEK